MARPKLLSSILLYPVSLIYGAVTFVRNKLFDMGVLKQQSCDIPTVVVGNISVGGTGKTPLVEYIVEALSVHHNIAVLSRGYKRKTKGFVLADRKSTPRDIGDESYQIYHKFGCRIPVAVCENRVEGVKQIQEKCKKVNLIVLDDAFQHRYLKPTVSIVVTEKKRPVFSDHLLPYGRLRESKKALHRADMVVVSKCPADMKPCDYMIFATNLNLYPYQKAYFSSFEYGQLAPVFPRKAPSVAPALHWLNTDDMVLAVAGIGNPKPFVRYIKSHKARVWVNVFPDHHEFDDSDLKLIERRFNKLSGKHNFIITTEKDAVRLTHNPNFPEALKPYIYYLPIRVKFMRDEDAGFADDLNKLIKTNQAAMVR